MKGKNEKFSPPSLAQHFDPPDGYVGHFGWLCGFSAGAAFLNDAAERFTTLTLAQRQNQGQIALAVMLDPGNPAISIVDAPAVAHLPIKDFEERPFRLLHAKVALLGFRHEKENIGKWHLRLIVSTGNWTRQTVEESLDIAWCVDVASAELGDDPKQVNLEKICADIKAANDLLQWLGALFDTRLLDASLNGEASETNRRKMQLEGWIRECTRKTNNKSRFFDSREKSLLKQLRSKIKSCTNETARNYLAMGSGFYETNKDQTRPPKVPRMIIDELKKWDLLTKKPLIDLFVNPKACQAIATSVLVMNQQDITVRDAVQPPNIFGDSSKRTLHAKFLFSANHRDNSNFCNSAWIYIGSGNLTSPGFMSKMSLSAGNLEAGVVFAPKGLLRKNKKNCDKKLIVTNLLPIQWDHEVNSDENQLSPGPGMEPRGEPYIAAPVAWFSWHEEERELRAPDSDTPSFQMLDSEGKPCAKTESGFLWLDQQPRQVFVRWVIDGKSQEAAIPVIDQYGRIAAVKLLPIDIDEAWWQLADFPMPPDDDDENNPDGDYENDGSFARVESTSPLQILRYPIRQMMELIELIAAKQTEINENNWSLWCKRLEQTLSRAKDNKAVEYFRTLGVNPLSALRQEFFRPSFAETAESSWGQMYENTLAGIEKAWNVDQLQPFGEQL